jgi:hypothetical protein
VPRRFAGWRVKKVEGVIDGSMDSELIDDLERNIGYKSDRRR